MKVLVAVAALTTSLGVGLVAPATPAMASAPAADTTVGGAGRGPITFGPPRLLTPTTPSGYSQVGYVAVSGDGHVVTYSSDRPDLLPDDRFGADVFYEVDGHRSHPYRDEQMRSPKGARTYYATCSTVSRDGRYVVFSSNSPRLVPDDTNDEFDLFVHDRVAGTTDRVNVSDTGAQSPVPVCEAVISADGRYVAFASTDPDLVPGDTNGETDVFVRDRVARTTTRVSVSSTGRQANSASGDADSVLAMSADGRFIGFDSWASNLVPGDTNKVTDGFLHDRATGTTERLTVDDQGHQMTWNPVYKRATVVGVNSISDDGRYVSFGTDGTGIGGVALTDDHNPDQFLRDRRLGTTILVSQRDGRTAGTNPGIAGGGTLSADGRLLVFIGRSAVLSPFSTTRVFYAYDTATGTLSRAPGPINSVASLTADGRTIAYVRTDPAGTAESSVIAVRDVIVPP